MSSVVLSEALLTVAVVVAASIFSVVFVSNLQLLLNSQQEKMLKLAENMEIKVEIIFADALQSNDTVKVWVKNIGQKPIPRQLIGLDSGLFLKKRGGEVWRIPYNADVKPSWNFTLLNSVDEEWDPEETLEVTISLPDGTLDVGDWIVRFVAPINGAYDDYVFSL